MEWTRKWPLGDFIPAYTEFIENRFRLQANKRIEQFSWEPSNSHHEYVKYVYGGRDV